MTSTAAVGEISSTRLHRYRLNRAGILNVWQYDDQQFDFAEGRLLLRGANGAGKSKTLEMLLPFVLDGDKARMTASARHHTSLLWLMTDGYDGQARVGYLWVEFARPTSDDREERFTCGVGIRASASARTATAWFFTTPRRVGDDLLLEDDGGPLSRPRLVVALGEGGHVFDQARAYKEHVGRMLFGLEAEQYDEVLRLLYWLRQPQVGEDIEPTRLAGQLLQSLPQLDDQAVRAAGDTFDELAAFGEQIDRREAAAHALDELAAAYERYARAVAADRSAVLLSAHREQARRGTDLRRAEQDRLALVTERDEVEQTVGATKARLEEDRGRLRQVQESPEARSQQRLTDLAERVRELGETANTSDRAVAELADQLRRRRQRSEADRMAVLERVTRLTEAAREVARELGSVTEDGTFSTLLSELPLVLEQSDDAARADHHLAAFASAAHDAQLVIGRRQAAVVVVRDALDVLVEAERAGRTEETRAAEAERRWEGTVTRASEAERAAEQAAQQLWTALQEWVARPEAPTHALPEELTVGLLEDLPASARRAAGPRLREFRTALQLAATRRQQASETLTELDRRRRDIEDEPVPAPAPAAWHRTDRGDGSPLWRLVDFADGVPTAERAALEAALHAAGLLDAWVRPSGAVLDPEHLDTVLPLGPACAGPSLSDVLVPDLPPDSDVTHEVVRSVLDRVAVHPSPPETALVDDTWVTRAGEWSTGTVEGRAAKAKAQHIGATARADERRRRLEAVLALVAETEAARDAAQSLVAEHTRDIETLEGWLAAVPSAQPLLSAWTSLAERQEAATREEHASTAAREQAQAARREVTRRRGELQQLAREHQAPADADGLAALGERLRSLVTRFASLADVVPAMRQEIQRWRGEHEAVTADTGHLEQAQADAERARARANRSAAELEELERAVGADVATLRSRLEALRSAIGRGERDLDEDGRRLRELDRAGGAAESAVESARLRVAEHDEVLRAAATRLAALVRAPGLLTAASRDGQTPEQAALVAAESLAPGDALPRGLMTTARALSDPEAEEASTAYNDVYRAHNETQTGPAADHEVRVVVSHELLAVVGRDDGGEHPVTELATRVAAAVEQDRGLLTQRERDQFEQHILGELGDAIRRRRLEAEELVAAMNGLLGGVSTSQGIRVRLDWRLRDDVASEAREATRLLTQPIGALLPEERTSLRDSLHRLIEASRAEQPELAYAEHLAMALDYRRWFAFRIRYTRPEAEGRWLDLHRRSPLSQGEQKVLCYLPLFAAAAAHFTSLAGAAPYAPRLVLLDDAFPKIDVRTHPLLFGLLVQLDLDFVITSERLWGDHESLPSLAIYEALRNPSERGIAQYEFRWDGRVLRAMH